MYLTPEVVIHRDIQNTHFAMLLCLVTQASQCLMVSVPAFRQVQSCHLHLSEAI